MNELDKLLFGKSDLRRVVGLEMSDNGVVEIFQQNEDGSISSIFTNSKFWLLSDRVLDKKFAKLDGDLFYKYGRQFETKSEFLKWRSIWRKNEVYSIYNTEEALMVKDGITFYRDLKPKDVSLMSFDLETTGIDETAPDAQILLISTTYRDIHGQVNKLFVYDDYENEAEMLLSFCEYIREKNPSLIIGHNIITFDFVYLQAMASKYGATLDMGRDESKVKFNDYDSKVRLDGTRDLLYKGITIYGREVVDTFFLSLSFDVSKSFENYKLKSMIAQLGFEKEGRTHYDASQIRYNFKNPVEWEKIKAYAIDDAEDAVKLWDYMGPLYFNMAPMMPKPFTEIVLSASGSKLNGLLVRAYLQDRHSIPKAEGARKYKGALSFGVPGIYSNCFKIDLEALYPNIQLEFEVCDTKKDCKKYILTLIKIFKEDRLKYKTLAEETGDDYWIQRDTTSKSILNSFYGMQGAPGLNFNSFDSADFITAKGREILEFTIHWASNKDLKEFVIEDENEEETA